MLNKLQIRCVMSYRLLYPSAQFLLSIHFYLCRFFYCFFILHNQLLLPLRSTLYINCYLLYIIINHLFSTILFARYTVNQADITTDSVSCVSRSFSLLFFFFFLSVFCSLELSWDLLTLNDEAIGSTCVDGLQVQN